jgi:hypothetical protein
VIVPVLYSTVDHGKGYLLALPGRLAQRRALRRAPLRAGTPADEPGGDD